MGCFNGTCGVSNLPIFAGDDIVLIPLIKTTDRHEYNTCYPCDNFSPLGFVIFGQYDDYGGIENAKTTNINVKFLRSLQFATKNKDGDYKVIDTSDNVSFDDFLSNIICTSDSIFVKTPMGKDGKYYAVDFMMVHKELYHLMIENIGKRIPYGHTNSYRDLLFDNLQKTAYKEIDNLQQYYKIATETNNSKSDQMISLSRELAVRTISKDVLQYGNLVTNNIWDFFANSLLYSHSIDAILANSTDKLLFQVALSAARKGYLCTSGCGSQSEETKMHYIIAEFTINFIRKTAKHRYDQNRQGVSSFGHEETIFF